MSIEHIYIRYLKGQEVCRELAVPGLAQTGPSAPAL